MNNIYLLITQGAPVSTALSGCKGLVLGRCHAAPPPLIPSQSGRHTCHTAPCCAARSGARSLVQDSRELHYSTICFSLPGLYLPLLNQLSPLVCHPLCKAVVVPQPSLSVIPERKAGKSGNRTLVGSLAMYQGMSTQRLLPHLTQMPVG